MKDDEQAKKARAESLHKQIDQLKEGKNIKKESSESKETPSGSETPAEFIHRRMEELNKEKQDTKSDE